MISKIGIRERIQFVTLEVHVPKYLLLGRYTYLSILRKVSSDTLKKRFVRMLFVGEVHVPKYSTNYF